MIVSPNDVRDRLNLFARGLRRSEANCIVCGTELVGNISDQQIRDDGKRRYLSVAILWLITAQASSGRALLKQIVEPANKK